MCLFTEVKKKEEEVKNHGNICSPSPPSKKEQQTLIIMHIVANCSSINGRPFNGVYDHLAKTYGYKRRGIEAMWRRHKTEALNPNNIAFRVIRKKGSGMKRIVGGKAGSFQKAQQPSPQIKPPLTEGETGTQQSRQQQRRHPEFDETETAGDTNTSPYNLRPRKYSPLPPTIEAETDVLPGFSCKICGYKPIKKILKQAKITWPVNDKQSCIQCNEANIQSRS